MIPSPLLEQANLSPGEDIQILCLDRAIVLCGTSTLDRDDLEAVLQQLQQPGDQRGIREYPRKVRTFTPLQEKRACLAERSFHLIDDLFPVHIRQHAEDQCVYRIEPTLLKRDVFPQFSIIQYSLHKHLPL